jgi:hydrophobic/amphiphilic exporter-1 (mainly G- bacteria), HAE1 family
MNISEPFIKRPIMTTLAMFALLVAGLIAYKHLPISSMPNVTYPTINVKVSFPGALPSTMATSVALPLEKQFMAIPGLRFVGSNNTLGATSIVLQFEIDKNMTTAAQDVQSAITSAIPYLPPNLPFGPTYRKVNPAEQPIIYLALTSKTLNRADLYTYGNTLIGQRISMIEGVSQVTTYGSLLAIRVQADPAKLAAYDITLAELAAAIDLENAFIATGQLDGPIEAPIISIDGQLTKSSDYESMVVAYRNGTPLKVQDIGRAVDSFANNKIYSQYIDVDGNQPAVILAIQKEPEANTVAIADSIYTLLDTLKPQLPAAIDLHVVFDRSIPVREAINDAIKTLVIALILVIVVIFFFLGKIKDTLIPSIVLPMSVVTTFIVMSFLHFTLDSLSVLALTLAVGFIIDDAVVVLENIVRRIEEGESPLEASLNGAKQISFTVISMTVSLVAVFIPMLFMGGLIGKIFKEFAITLTAITVISGLISLTLTPMLSSRFLPPHNAKAKEMENTSWSYRITQKMQKYYRQALLAVLHHRITAILVAISCTLATLLLFFYLPTDFVPDEDLGFFIVYTQEREGGSSYSMLDKENQLIKLLKNHPAVEKLVSISSYSEYRKGLNLVHLKPRGERPSIQKVIQEIYQGMQKIKGMQGFIKNMPLIDLATGQESRGAYQFALESLFTDKIYPSAAKLLAKMKQDPLFQGVNSDMEVETPQININILRDKASTLGVSATDVENSFSLSYSSNFISRIQTAIDQYYVILELYPEYQQQVSTLDQIWLRSSTSTDLVPLSATIEVEEGLGASSVNHIDQFPAVIMSFDLAPGVALETALDKLNAYTQEVVANEVTTHPIGAAQTFKESIQSAGYLLLLTIFCIYIILGILYESFIHPITILTTLPPATFGGLFTLLIFNLPLSMYSFLGIILLIGIVKKNGIMMVDFALDNIRYKGMPAQEAILDACMVRFRPIMMTTAAAIFGVLPIALGFGANASARRPLGLVIIGGLLFSQLITLFITPIIYLVMERFSEKIGEENEVKGGAN